MKRARVNRPRPLNLLLAASLFPLGSLAAEEQSMPQTLYGFSSPETSGRWSAVNDTVMGGTSQGFYRVDTERKMLQFSGRLSLENNGGFASVRSEGRTLDLSDFDGIAIRVRGDGRSYDFTLRTDYRIFAGSYRMTFETTPDRWLELHFPFDEFSATSFGRQLSSAPPVNRGQIESVGFLVADKKEGEFELQVDWIQAYRAREDTRSGSTEDVVTATQPEPLHDDGDEVATSARVNHREMARRLIVLAVDRGAPLYNAGNPAACSAIYEVTVHALKGFGSEVLTESLIERMDEAMDRVKSVKDSSRKAWMLRHLLDEVYRYLHEGA